MDEKIEKIETQDQSKPLIHDFDKESVKNAFTPKVIALLFGVIVVGILSGYLASAKTGGLSTSGGKGGLLNSSSSVAGGTIVGSNDTKTFSDIAEGALKEGGINGEGAFHLERPGGDSQNVYLTSSSVDLSKFIGKKIKVWGQTQKAQSAGWLMDVGRVQVM